MMKDTDSVSCSSISEHDEVDYSVYGVNTPTLAKQFEEEPHEEPIAPSFHRSRTSNYSEALSRQGTLRRMGSMRAEKSPGRSRQAPVSSQMVKLPNIPLNRSKTFFKYQVK